MKKAVDLGVPYSIFSMITWFLKILVISKVNIKPEGLLETLLFNPISPYWYLYTLFLIFLLTPVMRNRKMAVVIMVMSLLGKAAVLTGGYPYAISLVLSNEIWFAAGMCFSLSSTVLDKRSYFISGLLSNGLFWLISIVIYVRLQCGGWMGFLLGIFGVLSTILLLVGFIEQNIGLRTIKFWEKYTWPIFLMHTLFAAPVRICLLQMGIRNGAVHIAAGLAASVAGPVVFAKCAERIKLLEFALYPGEFIRIYGKK